jgi:hypothetical protein
MSRFAFTVIMIIALATVIAAPVSAAEPVLVKRVVTEDDGTAVVVVDIRAADRAIYGVTITDASGSITDIIAPKGWAGISSGDRVVFMTTDTPVAAGKSVAFKMVTTDKSARLNVTFRDAQNMIHVKQTI